MEVLRDAAGIDNTVMTQGHARLPIEEGNVTVNLEELPPDRLPTDPKSVDNLAALNMLLDDLLQIVCRADAIKRLVRLDQNVRTSFFCAGAARAKATSPRDIDLLHIDAGFLEQSRKCRFQACTFFPAATIAAAAKELEGVDSLDRSVQDSRQERLVVLNVPRENLVYQFPVDSLVLDWDLARHKDANDRLTTTTACASGLVQEDVVPAGGHNVLTELLEDLPGAGRVLASSRSHLNHNRLILESLPTFRFRLTGQFLVALLYSSHGFTQIV